MSESISVGALPETWRKKAADDSLPNRSDRFAWRECADELAEALKTSQVCGECGCAWIHPDQALCPRCLALGTAIHYEQLKAEAAERIRTLEAQVGAEARTGGGWHPIETLPDGLGRDFLGWYRVGRIFTVIHWPTAGRPSLDGISHWMLPSAPTERP